MAEYMHLLNGIADVNARELARKSALEWKHQMESRMLTRAWRAMYAMSQEVESRPWSTLLPPEQFILIKLSNWHVSIALCHPPQNLKGSASQKCGCMMGPEILSSSLACRDPGKASVLKAFEDLGYYCVDNLPIGLIPRFADLAKQSSEIETAALVADIREGEQLKRLPAIIRGLKKQVNTTVLFLEAQTMFCCAGSAKHAVPTRSARIPPLNSALSEERQRLQPIRDMADFVVDSSRFNVHELRAHITAKFTAGSTEKDILISIVELWVQDRRPPVMWIWCSTSVFLPNPHFVPEFRPLTGRHPQVAKYNQVVPADTRIHQPHL